VFLKVQYGNGGGLRAIVSEVEGIDITDITTSTLSYDNVTLSWYENNIVYKILSIS